MWSSRLGKILNLGWCLCTAGNKLNDQTPNTHHKTHIHSAVQSSPRHKSCWFGLNHSHIILWVNLIGQTELGGLYSQVKGYLWCPFSHIWWTCRVQLWINSSSFFSSSSRALSSTSISPVRRPPLCTHIRQQHRINSRSNFRHQTGP